MINLLIVEDSETQYKMLAKMVLAKTGEGEANIHRATSSLEAVDKLASFPIDVVLLDLNLTDTLGFDTYRRIRQTSPTVPVIVISGVTECRVIVDTLREGADDYLIKGDFGIETLFAAIQSSIRKRQDVCWLRNLAEGKIRELEKAIGFTYSVAKAQTWILQHDVLDDEPMYLLQKFGQMADVSRAYVYRLHQDENGEHCHYEQLAEWCADGVPSQLPIVGGKQVPCIDSYGSPYQWHVELSEGNCLVGHIKDMGHLHFVIDMSDIKSIAVSPIFTPRNGIWGIVGFDECRHEREWTGLEVNTLKVVGGLLAWVQEKIESNNRIVEAASQIDGILTDMHNFNARLDKINSRLAA